MANLYELDAAIQNFELDIDEETGEITNLYELEALQMERETKLENIALWIKNLKADAEAYKKEKDSFAEKERVAKNKMERLKAYLQFSLAGQKFNTSKVQISYRKSTAVEITNLDAIPAAFKKQPDPIPDKVAIKKLLADGDVEMAGAHLTQKTSLVIK